MKTNVELIDPEEIFRLLNRELPEDVRSHVLVAGSRHGNDASRSVTGHPFVSA